MVNSKSEEEEEEKEWVGEEGRVLDLGWWLCVLLPIFWCLHPQPAVSTGESNERVDVGGFGRNLEKKRGWRKYNWYSL